MTELTDRYVFAATRFVADQDEREQLDRELRERIADTVDDHRSAGLGPDEAEVRALTELGDPLRLSAAYRERPMYLIGPRYYFAWQRVMVIVLATAPWVVGVIDLIVALSEGEPIGTVIAGTISTIVIVALHVAFWTTLGFAIAERATSPDDSPHLWTPDRLPQLPESNGRGKLGDLIASLVFLVIVAGLLVWQQFGSLVVVDGERIPVLEPALWRSWIPVMFLLLALEAVHAVWVYRTGWTWPAAIVNLPISLVWGALLGWLFASGRLLNPDFLDRVGLTPDIVDHSKPYVLAVLAIVIAWEIGDGLYKAYRQRPGAPDQRRTDRS
ncbi:hypothetical protein JL108_17635 [Aeromicrobium sp. YIM 150415]|uniref:permease prefix domain 1-containing protein n=1 Tax=Aeromicrobium sp. YIM 150415 TaxID=2803912 RepID=UPI001963BB7F|nr:permease prefix domain 1-containing protein [Aeromicrobium sp. YIM 150415]MBM9465274.1 hypothetical protein [Aeromicrobium sp. YIM 150415]